MSCTENWVAQKLQKTYTYIAQMDDLDKFVDWVTWPAADYATVQFKLRITWFCLFLNLFELHSLSHTTWYHENSSRHIEPTTLTHHDGHHTHTHPDGSSRLHHTYDALTITKRVQDTSWGHLVCVSFFNSCTNIFLQLNRWKSGAAGPPTPPWP